MIYRNNVNEQVLGNGVLQAPLPCRYGLSNDTKMSPNFTPSPSCRVNNMKNTNNPILHIQIIKLCCKLVPLNIYKVIVKTFSKSMNIYAFCNDFSARPSQWRIVPSPLFPQRLHRFACGIHCMWTACEIHCSKAY